MLGRLEGQVRRLGRVLDRVLATRRDAPPDDPEVWVRFRAVGADRYLIGWSRGYGSDLARAWNDCPRSDWLIDLVVRARVERPTVVSAVREVGERAVATVPELRRAVEGLNETADRWAAGRADAEALVASAAAIAGAVADFGTARAAARRGDELASIPVQDIRYAAVHTRLLADHEAHLEGHAPLADGVRLHVAFALIERALGCGKPASPYR
ncbi:MAG: hypothetical protein IT379_29080 [Deltaproteobacteria bacterium]|nr:hypothetical protein [Deltaproteobacteria bacterium]